DGADVDAVGADHFHMFANVFEAAHRWVSSGMRRRPTPVHRRCHGPAGCGGGAARLSPAAMADVRTLPGAETAPEAPPSPRHVAIRREDYRPPDWLVPEISLDFGLGTDRTRVRATLNVERNGDHDRPLRLDGDGLKPVSVDSDGEWRMDGQQLVIELSGNRATVATEVEIDPAANTKLMGLYASGGMLCTQCEAEGFRRITFFPDRPDVLSKYRVRMEGDGTAFPVLLSNGNRVASGHADDGRHWAEWEDPFPSLVTCLRWSQATSRPIATASRR